MRHLVSLALLCAALPVAALAQEQPTRSPEDYVCELTGECGDTAEAEATQPGKPRVNATRGFSLTRPAQQAAKPAASAPRAAASTARPRTSSKPAVKTASVNRARPAAAKPGRVDLRLTFQLGSAELTPQARAEAKIFAQALQLPQLSSRKFVIEGHTDAQGSRAYNLDLSQRRARAVADYLGSLGISSDRFEVRGYGFDRPLPGRSAASQDNRRVEAVLIS
jgi:outer membrane protein OmpA-like peptidoglycan-associated protein